MGADLIAQIPVGERYAQSARGWLDGVLTEVFPELREGLRTGQFTGEIAVGTGDPRGGRYRKFSESRWQRTLAGFDDSPQTAWLSVGEAAAVGVSREDDEDWVRFTFSAARSGPGCEWAESPGLQGRWAEFVKRQAARIGAVTGFMSDDQSPSGETALELAIITGPAGGENYKRRREVLYGYSWVTIVPAELAPWLGGVAALTRTGAFFEVSVLPDGALWLRATPTINEFTGDRIRAVFEALAPVLATGRTRFIGFEPRLVEGVDAADYQSPEKTPPRPARLPPPDQASTLWEMEAALWTDRSDAELAGAEAGWILGVLRTLIPDLLAATDTRPATAEMPVKDPLGWPLVGPDTLAGVLQIGVEHGRPPEVLYSRTRWRQLLAALDKTPALLEIRVDVFGPDGGVLGGGEVRVERSMFEPGWVRFGFSASRGSTGWPWSPDMQDQWARLLREQAERIGACTGFMTDTGEPGGTLSMAFLRPGRGRPVVNPDASITKSRQVLQDYCWITIVPPELAARLGGATALRSSGAFCEVSELTEGSVWLRATPTINEFTGERIEAVLRALAPVLLTGRTEFPFGYLRLVENADAADYR
jgi:hypothetical protein